MGGDTLPSLHRQKLEEITAAEATLPLLEGQLAKLLDLSKSSPDPVTRRDSELDATDLQRDIDQIKGQRMSYVKQNSELYFKFMEHNSRPTRQMYTLDDIKQTQTFVARKENSEKFLLYQKYRANIDPDHVYAPSNLINEENYCFDCESFRVLHTDDATMICEKCRSQTIMSIFPERPSAKDPPAESHLYQYKRYVHFCDCLDNLQGKESASIPKTVLDTVTMEIHRTRMDTKLDYLTEEDIREFLKKHKNKKFDQYYDHATQILFKITNMQPIQMTPEMEENLKIMFIAIQEPFDLFKDKRRNFSSYSYIIYKFCQLLEYKDFLPKLRLHKDHQKLHEHDMIWKKICEHMGGEEKGWKFIKSYAY